LENDVTQLLGVGEDGNLVVSGRRLWWLDVYTGGPSKKVLVNPFPAGEFSSPVGVGRGLLSGGNIFWPTQGDDIGKIFVPSQSDRHPARQPIDLGAEKLELVTSTHLLVSAPDRLTGYKLDGRQE